MIFKNCYPIILPTTDTNPVNVPFVKNDIATKEKLKQHCAGGEFRKLLDVGFKPHHLYILSNDKIQEGDWFIELDLKGTRSSYANKPYLCDIGNTGNFILTKNNGNFPFPENCRKIIATTDKSLCQVKYTEGGNVINGGRPIYLPSIYKEFIRKYVEAYNAGKPITRVLVEYGEHRSKQGDFEGSFLKVNPSNEIFISDAKNTWNEAEVTKLLQNQAAEIDDLYRPYTSNNSLGEENLPLFISKNI